MNTFQRIGVGFVVVCGLIAAGGPERAWAQGEAPIFNPGFEEKKRASAKERKKLVVPSFTRHIKLMREICQAIATDGRLEDFQKVAGAQPNFSLDCPTCRPFFRIWFSSCQISGTGNLKFSPPEEPTPTPVETPIAPTAGGTTVESVGEAGVPPSPGSEGTPGGDVGVEPPAGAPTASPTETPAPVAAEPVAEEEEDEAEGEEGSEEEGGEPAPTPTPTPRPIVPERDPNIVVLDLVSRLFQSLADAEGAELSLMAVDLFVAELRSPSGKSEGTRAYFDTLAEYMVAPFEGMRAELAASLAAHQEAAGGVKPEANVDEMFDF
ncbi:MAG: hypothetical protein RL417_178 [Pseudomonadota bacterium]